MIRPIIAISTSSGNSAIGIIRISFGNILIDYDFFFLKIFKKKIRNRYATYVNFYHNNFILDSGVVIFFSKPNSYTGEDILEFHGHGNYLNLKYILKIFLLIFKNFKIRIAKNGEFTKRALINKKINLLQVNNILNLINLNNNLSLKYLHYNLNFNLYLKLKRLYFMILNIKYNLIYNLINLREKENFLKLNYKLNYIIKKIFEIYKTINYNNNNLEKSIILLGFPNTGKSTLINKIINDNSLIVDKNPGTTRDLVNRNIFFKNLPVNLFDTAGLRKTNNKIENHGIKLAFKQIKKSEIIIYVYNKELLKNKYYLKVLKYLNKYNKFILVMNKVDLLDNFISLEFLLINNISKNIIIKISAKYNLGVNLLYIEIDRCLILINKISFDNDNFIINYIRKIYKFSNILKKSFKNFNINFLLINLNKSLFYIKRIINFKNKKKFNNLFKKFCIGK